MLHQVLLRHLQTFLARTDERAGSGLPRFVRRELYRYLDCGILANGFARLHCAQCGRDELVAFSCKGRGFCPSCCGRRMAGTAMHLADEVLPAVPIRQWVLSFPYRVRFLLAHDAKLCGAVRRILVRTLLGWLRERAESAGIRAGRSGAVVVAQRFGSALNLNLHFHALVLDGVYSNASPLERPVFRRSEPLTDQDVVELTTRLHRRILRYLSRCGRLPKDEPAGEELQPDEPLLAELYAASVQGRVAIGEESGASVERVGRRRDARPLFLPGELCCHIDGFSLHAKVEIAAHDRDGLERLCRYLARPPLATERLSIAKDGRVVYALRRHWKDGTSAVVFDPLDFIARLAALVPRPRTHLLTYHGVLAPAAEWRDWIVPGEASSARREPSQSLAAEALRPKPRSTWAELLKRVFEIDVLTCPWCGGKRKLIALLTDGKVVRRILEHLGLPTTAPTLAPARSPPEFEFVG
ncbi:MAG: IS91 family transposase [Planctomycetes bacterium]|nr:IS91 family transposase [Planctomycetota bacterium]